MGKEKKKVPELSLGNTIHIVPQLVEGALGLVVLFQTFAFIYCIELKPVSIYSTCAILIQFTLRNFMTDIIICFGHTTNKYLQSASVDQWQ